MPFLPRNRYYLRVSPSSILPLYVYLDSQHVDWMSDRVLRQVVADLRPKILPKLRAESDAYLGPGPAPANAMRGTVDVHRGDTYQFAYFLRESESHSVLVKTRNFVLETEPPPSKITSSDPVEQPKGKRKAGSSRKEGHKTRASQTKSRKSRDRRETGGNGEDEEDYHPSDPESFADDDILTDEDEELDATEDISMGTTKRTGVDVEVEVGEHSHGLPQTKSPHVEDTGGPIEVDEDDEPKPKLALEMKYRAFSDFNRCLCVVVEPWPPQRSGSRAPSLTPSAATRASTVAPITSEFSANHSQRAKTPLFLPDVDDEPTTPTDTHIYLRTLPPVPLFDDPPTHDTDVVEEWDDKAELMQFSQMLNTTGRIGGVDVEEEDEFDGTALFADADEAKEL